MGLYARVQDVKTRLAGKVRFTDDPTDDEKSMPIALLNMLISEAEAQVELDLSSRYAAPFQTDSGQPFSSLPERPTKLYIRTVAELMSVIRVLETDFGRGTAAEGNKYAQSQKDRYDFMINKLLKKVEDQGQTTYRQWTYPPLPGLMLNYMNTEADDGYAGQVLVTSQGDGDFPQAQINNPSQNFWNGHIDHIDAGGRPDNDEDR